MAQNEQVRFNIRNAKYALLKANGTYETPVDFGTSTKISLEPDSSTKVIYGDGRKIATIISDKGKTGTLTLNNLCEAFEIAMGRRIQTSVGVAEIAQQSTPTFALYFEVTGYNDGKQETIKTWIYGVTSPTPPSEEYDQTEDDINESTFDLEFEIAGCDMLDANGEKVAVDDNGNEIRVWKLAVEPGEEGYDNFGDAVVIPQLASD